MYLIGIRKNYHPLGNAGTFRTRYKSVNKIKEVAQNLAKMYQLDEIYLMEYYSQKMCEMNNKELVDYVREKGKRIT